MFKLMKLEVNRNKMKTYVYAAVIITVSLLALIYIFAVMPKLDEADSDMDLFMSYNSIAMLTCLVSMVCFSILSSVMHAKFIIEEYFTTKAILLFSYPVGRKKIFNAKIAMIFLFTVAAMLLSMFITFGIFFLSEAIFPICADVLSMSVVAQTLLFSFIYSIMAGTIAIVSLMFGMWKQSTPATLISSIIITCVLAQFLGYTLDFPRLAIIFTLITSIAAIIVTIILNQKVSAMEV